MMDILVESLYNRYQHLIYIKELFFMANDPIIIPSDEDIQANKGMAVLSYIGILFLVPMLARKDSEFCRFHVNQGLVLFIIEVIINIATMFISFVGFLGIITFVFMIMGIVNCVKGEVKPLPLIGGIQLYK